MCQYVYKSARDGGALVHTIKTKFINKFSPPGGCLLLKETVITERRRGAGERRKRTPTSPALRRRTNCAPACLWSACSAKHRNECRVGFTSYSCKQTQVQTAHRGSTSPSPLLRSLFVLITFSWYGTHGHNLNTNHFSMLKESLYTGIKHSVSNYLYLVYCYVVFLECLYSFPAKSSRCIICGLNTIYTQLEGVLAVNCFHSTQHHLVLGLL